jgi:hypothetical protein
MAMMMTQIRDYRNPLSSASWVVAIAGYFLQDGPLRWTQKSDRELIVLLLLPLHE